MALLFYGLAAPGPVSGYSGPTPWRSTMKKKLLVIFGSLAVTFMWAFLVVQPVAAFSGIQFDIKDNVTGQPWGTAPGQSYQIAVVAVGGAGTQIYNSGPITTPVAPPLAFTCDFGVACPALASAAGGDTIPTPNVGDSVTVYVILNGTVGDPSTISFDFIYFGNLGAPFTFNGGTGTGPTAVTLQSANASTTGNLPLMAAVVTMMLAVVSGFIIIRRHPAPHTE